MKTERRERKEEKNRLWGPMKGKPNEQGQTADKPNLIRETCCRSLVCVQTRRARGKRGQGEEEKRGKERRRQRCSQLRHMRPGTHQKEGLPAMTKHPGTPREEGEERKERRKERERERKGEERKVFPATNNRPGTHPRKRGVILSTVLHSGKPQKTIKERGREGGEGGAKCSTGSNEPQKYFGRSDHVEALSQLGPLRSRKGMSQLGIPKMRQNSSYVRPRPPSPALGIYITSPGRGDNDVHPFDGSTGGTLQAHPGLAQGQTHLRYGVRN